MQTEMDLGKQDACGATAAIQQDECRRMILESDRASKMYQLVMMRVAGEYRANGKHSTFRSVPSGEAGKQHTGCFLPALQKA